MSDEQLATIWDHVGDSLGLLSIWINSAALWEVIGITLGAIIAVSLVTMVINNFFSSFRFRR